VSAKPTSSLARRQGLACLLGAALAAASLTTCEAAAASAPALALRAKYEAFQDRLNSAPFGLPLHIDSEQASEWIAGNLYGVVDHPFSDVRAALTDRAQWCAVLVLHLNVKGCRLSDTDPPSGLTLRLGGKNDMAGEGNTRLDYRYRVAAIEPDYLEVVRRADVGPYGTRNHQIVLQATAVPDGRTFLHLACSHDYGPVARVAMATYLRTVAKDKVGFTVVDRGADGRPVYVNGIRGVIERNGMRYFLAVIAYLHTRSAPPSEQLERRIDRWFDLTDRFPQLRELTKSQYVTAKLQESRRSP
jgi:hypothetical protein